MHSETTEKHLEYKKFKNVMKYLLAIVGLWSSKKSNFLFRSLLCLHISFFLIPIIGVFNFFKTHISNVNLATKSLSTLVGFSTVMMKAVCIQVNRKDVNELHETLDSYYDDLIRKPKVSNIVSEGITTFRRLPILITGFVTLTCTSYAIVPILSIINQWRYDIHPIKYNLIFPTVYPWHPSPHTFIYNFHFVNEYLTTFSIIFITGSFDSLFIYHIFQIIGILREIAHDISLIDQDTNSEIIVRQCVIKYEILLECRHKIEKIYGPIILWTMKTNAIILCAVIFQLSHAKTIPITVAMICAGHAGLKLTQVYLYAWSGTRLTTESDKLRDAIYNANWIGNKQLINSLIIMLTQKPLVMRAYHFTTVSIDMFSAVINTTISYYLLLKTFEPNV